MGGTGSPGRVGEVGWPGTGGFGVNSVGGKGGKSPWRTCCSVALRWSSIRTICSSRESWGCWGWGCGVGLGVPTGRARTGRDGNPGWAAAVVGVMGVPGGMAVTTAGWGFGTVPAEDAAPATTGGGGAPGRTMPGGVGPPATGVGAEGVLAIKSASLSLTGLPESRNSTSRATGSMRTTSMGPWRSPSPKIRDRSLAG